MTVKVKVNGSWQELGKDISWDDYEKHIQQENENYINKVASELGRDDFDFEVLDLERGADCDTLILKFGTLEGLGDFVNEWEVSHWNGTCNVLDVSCRIVKVRVWE